MNPIEKIVAEYGVMLLDGAFSTELERRGCDLNDPLWSAKILMESPEMIGLVHRDYFEAGADCATTASYQATVEGFMKRGLSQEAALDLITLSVDIARRVRDEFWSTVADKSKRPYPLVAASVGPYGAYLADGSEYRGDYGRALGEEALMGFHRRRLQTLVAAGPDLLACETIPCLAEALALARLLSEFPGNYAWISFSARDGKHINSGEAIADCARALDGFAQVAAIGINCTAPEHVGSLIEEIKKGTDKPILVYPNSGEQYDPATKSWHGTTAEGSYGNSARLWHEKGASIIGGCCRTSPADIREIAAWARAGCIRGALDDSGRSRAER